MHNYILLQLLLQLLLNTYIPLEYAATRCIPVLSSVVASSDVTGVSLAISVLLMM